MGDLVFGLLFGSVEYAERQRLLRDWVERERYG